MDDMQRLHAALAKLGPTRQAPTDNPAARKAALALVHLLAEKQNAIGYDTLIDITTTTDPELLAADAAYIKAKASVAN